MLTTSSLANLLQNDRLDQALRPNSIPEPDFRFLLQIVEYLKNQKDKF